jgi:hypothetical protein
MPEVYRQFDIVFTKAEIQEILTERALKIVRKRRNGGKDFWVRRVDDVEGQATARVESVKPEKGTERS